MSETRVDEDTTADGGNGANVKVCGTPLLVLTSWPDEFCVSKDIRLLEEPPDTCIEKS
jgi:hypothetical protein